MTIKGREEKGSCFKAQKEKGRCLQDWVSTGAPRAVEDVGNTSRVLGEPHGLCPNGRCSPGCPGGEAGGREWGEVGTVRLLVGEQGTESWVPAREHGEGTE